MNEFDSLDNVLTDKSGKPFRKKHPSSPNQDLNLDLPILNSQAQHETRVLDNYATKAGRKYAMLKLKVMISTILRNYKVISDTPLEKFALQGDIILKRADGFMIRLDNRKKTK
uniref:Uncharacterized protein n=1 Tax=Timema monikensis TaxID=170555 RepID=A0A7R9EA05_9NEOP|nr:unnamed protein product [Timema monikensis]